MASENYIPNGDYMQTFAHEPGAVNQQIGLTEIGQAQSNTIQTTTQYLPLDYHPNIGQTQSNTIQTTNAVESYRPFSHLKRSFYNTLEDTTELYKLLDSWQLSDLFDYFERE